MKDKNNLHHPENLIKRIERRNVYIWGARHEGYAARLALTRHDIQAAGYIDSSPSLAGTASVWLIHHKPRDFFCENNASKGIYNCGIRVFR